MGVDMYQKHKKKTWKVRNFQMKAYPKIVPKILTSKVEHLSIPGCQCQLDSQLK